MMAYITRLRALKDARAKNPDAILITERSLQTDCEVFAKMLRDSGDIPKIHWKIYETWASTLSPEVEPNLYVYVRAEPSMSMKRMKIRARESEATVSLDYLTKCHEKHEEWLMQMDRSRRLMFDANTPFVGTDRVRTLITSLLRAIL